MNIKTLTLIFIASGLTSLTACGPGRAASKESAVGVKTPLGRLLTKSQWCTPATNDQAERPTFVTLELRQNGKFVRSNYALAPNRALKRESREEGRWSLIFDQLYTTTTTPGAHEAQATVGVADPTAAVGSAAVKASGGPRTTTGESCITLTVTAQPVETYCSCDFVEN